MNRFLTLVIALFLSNFSFGQTLGIAPASPQRIIGQAAAQEESDFRNQFRAQGIVLELNAQRSEECTPDFLGNLVHAGESLDILLDTFDLSSDTSTPVLTILPVPAPKYGTVSLDEIRKNIEQKLRIEKINNAANLLLNSIRQRALIEINSI